MLKNYCFLILIILNLRCFSQTHLKSFEFSAFSGTALSFSKLSSTHTKEYSSPPSFGITYGIKLEKRILNSFRNISFNTCYISQQLSISSKYYFQEKTKSIGHSSSFLPTYDIWSLGINKSIPLNEKLIFNIEIGPKIHFSRKYIYSGKYLVNDYLDSTIYFSFQYDSRQSAIVIPYFGCGFSFKYKKIKFDAFFWTQRSIMPIIKFDTYTKYGNSLFNSKVISNGFAVGGQLGIKLLSF